jgi:hypothetical protein
VGLEDVYFLLILGIANRDAVLARTKEEARDALVVLSMLLNVHGQSVATQSRARLIARWHLSSTCTVDK